MAQSIQILMDESDVQNFTAFCDGMGRRTSREELLPILQKYFAPVAASERSALSSHTLTGALQASLVERSGPGDRPGTMSVFTTPTASRDTMESTWGQSGLSRHKRYMNSVITLEWGTVPMASV